MVRRPAADDEVPRCFWDRSVSAGELPSALADPEDDRRLRLLAVLWQARPGGARDYVSPGTVAAAPPPAPDAGLGG